MIKLISLKATQFKQLQDVDLRFPACGSVLIEGRNEAGKSTLFEAIYFALFGKTLLAGTTVEDLISYQSTEAIVQLEISVERGRVAIMRKVKRTKTRAGSDARLRVFDADGKELEEIRGASAVNERLAQELKLDADAFLNSCFVEQKKLEKLEGMNARDRETSLMRLLNMDRMLDEERGLRITVDDSRRLQRLEQRVKLAEVMAEIPGVQKRGRETKQALDIIAVKETLAGIARSRAAITEAEGRLAALEGPIRDLEVRVKRIEAVRGAAGAAEIISVRINALQQHAADVQRLRDQLADLDRAASEQLPALRETLRRTGALKGRWSRLVALGSDADSAAREAEGLKRRLAGVDAARAGAEELEKRLAEQVTRIAALETDERTLAAAERSANARQALEDWQAAAIARDGVAKVSRQTDEAAAAMTPVEETLGRARDESERLRRALRLAHARPVGALVSAAVFVALSFQFGAVSMALAAAFLVLFVVAMVDRKRQVANAGIAVSEVSRIADTLRVAQNAFVRLEGQMENARATSGAAAGRLEQAALRLESLGEAMPSSPDECLNRLNALPPDDEGLDPERLRAVRRDLGQAQGAFAEQSRALQTRRVEIASANVTVLSAQAERLDQRSARIREGIVGPWSEMARERAESLGIEPGDDLREAITRAEAGLAEQIRVKERSLTERPAIERRIAGVQQSSQRERDEVTAAWPAIATVLPEATVPEAPEQAASLRSDIASALDVMDETGTRAELRARRDERNSAGNDRTVAQRQMTAAESDLRKQAGVLKYPSDAPLTSEGFADSLPAWALADPAERTALEAQFEDLKDRNAALNARRTDLASALGLDPAKERLDPETERAQLEDVARDQGVREKAITILKAARERIMSKVLPYTIEHMRRILPALTMERYHDAKLTPDYKIEVWDERASMWKSKNIFSGGTRDQFSLALRLAFAVATLPQERGAAPGFIFLDEPLSSFDVERSSALMYLLTKGEIAETFDQILVISHSQTIAADDFQYRLRMDAGRIEDAPEEMRGLPEQMELGAANGVINPDTPADGETPAAESQ